MFWKRPEENRTLISGKTKWEEIEFSSFHLWYSCSQQGSNQIWFFFQGTSQTLLYYCPEPLNPTKEPYNLATKELMPDTIGINSIRLLLSRDIPIGYWLNTVFWVLPSKHHLFPGTLGISNFLESILNMLALRMRVFTSLGLISSSVEGEVPSLSFQTVLQSCLQRSLQPIQISPTSQRKVPW